MNKICVNCKTEYETKSKKSKYCSEKCKSKYKYENFKTHKHICKNCNKEFSSYRSDSNFCCKSCSAKYSKRNSLTIEHITDEIIKRHQISVNELVKYLNISPRTFYNILKNNGYNSYKEFIGVIKGVYIEKQRSDTSVSANICFDIISKILNEKYELEVYLDGLINYKTGNKLRLDCYFRKSNIAIEYNGIQHYKYIPFFHRGINTLEYQNYKDSIKKEYCNKKGIKLIIVSYKEELTYNNLKNLLSRDNQQLSQENFDNSILESSETNG